MTLRASPAMRQAAAENLAAGSADRKRSVAERAAHLARLKAQADRAAAAPFRSPDDAVQFLRFLIIAASRRLSGFAHAGEVENLHGALSRREVAPQVDVKARADAEWRRATANDRGDG